MESGARVCLLHSGRRELSPGRLHSHDTKPTTSPSASMAPSSSPLGQARRRWPASASLIALAGGQLCALLLLTLTQPAAGTGAGSAMNLPDGIENILGFVPKSSFQCERDGYFGDIDNDCRLFHLCQRSANPVTGRPEWRHWTYACGNQTMFNQLTLTCAFVDEAIPCRHASQFQYLNEVIHKPAEPFLTDADVTSGFSYYSNRIMSDGARARAFQDSELLAQIGGGGSSHSQASSNQLQRQQLHDAEAPQLHNELGSNQFRRQFEAAPLPASQPQQQQQQPQQQSFRFQTLHQPARLESQRFVSNFRQPQQLHQQQQQQQQQQQAPAQASTLRQFGQLQGHNFRIQHQPASASASARAETRLEPQPQARPLLQTQARLELPQANFQPLQSFQQQFAAAPAAAPVQTEPTASQKQPAQAFEFSITTNHQSIAGPTSQQSFFTLPLPQAPQQPAQAQESNRAELQGHQFGPRTPATPVLSVATTQPAVGRLSATEPTIGSITTQALAQSTTLAQTAAPTTTLAAPVTSTLTAVPFISTQRLQLVQPTQATQALAAAVTEATPSSLFQTSTELTTTPIATTPRVAVARTNPPTTSQQQARRTSVVASSERALPGFQSARLSSLSRRTSSANSETPLVMRRPQASPLPVRSGSSQQAAQQAGSQPPASGAQASSSARTALLEAPEELATNFMAGGDFWRRAFDSQLMAPKFESLMLRRRL